MTQESSDWCSKLWCHVYSCNWQH